MPGSVRTSTLVAATVAPVCPGVTMASTSFAFSSRAQVVIEESFLARSAIVEGSDISHTVSA